MVTTLGCWSDAAACASCRNRRRRSSCRAIESFMTLIATDRSSTESRARYTTPIAPSPTSSMILYLPMSGSWVSAIAENIGPNSAYCNDLGDGYRLLQRAIEQLNKLPEASRRIFGIEHLSTRNHPAMPRIVGLAGVLASPFLEGALEHLDLAVGHAIVVGGVAEVEACFGAREQAMRAGVIVLVESATVE